MIDIHCHILSGLDDGAKNMDESIAMARIAYDDGIRHIIATPHFTASYPIPSAIVYEKLVELQKELDRLRINVQLYPGHEVRLEDAQFVYKHEAEGEFFYLGSQSSHKFVLLEQPWSHYSEDSEEIIGWFLGRGTIPIIPHPERHLFFRERPELLLHLIRLGAWTQVSVDSLNGTNNEDARSFGRWMLEENIVHVLATDAHNVRRKPNLSEGFELVKAWMGEDQAEEIRKRALTIIA